MAHEANYFSRTWVFRRLGSESTPSVSRENESTSNTWDVGARGELRDTHLGVFPNSFNARA